jgi:hypothetical protein
MAQKHLEKPIKHISDMLKHVYMVVIRVLQTPSIGGETSYIMVAFLKYST